MASVTKNQCLAASGCHNLYPTRFFAAFIFIQVDLDPLSWKDETFGYTIPEEGKDHAKSTKDLHSGV